MGSPLLLSTAEMVVAMCVGSSTKALRRYLFNSSSWVSVVSVKMDELVALPNAARRSQNLRKEGVVFKEGLSFPDCAALRLRTKTTLSWPKLLRELDDMEGIRPRRREVYGPIPRIPAVGADVFGFFILCCIGDLVLASRLACQAPTHIMR